MRPRKFPNEPVPGWIPVKFATLTERNGVIQDDLTDNLVRFNWKLSAKTDCHFTIYAGIEGPILKGDIGNTHAHLIVCVASNDLSRWSKTSAKFKPWKYWRYKTIDYQDWKPGLDTWNYVLRKHEPRILPVRCPNVSRICRSGNCLHTV